MVLLTILAVFTLPLSLFFLFKKENTFKNLKIIADAIFLYHVDRMSQGYLTDFCDYTDMQSYDKTLLRFWDWGYENILPPDKFEIIKPYIKR